MEQIVITGAARTPVGKFGGALSSLSATELAACAIRAAIARAAVAPEDVDYVVLGNVLSAGLGQAPARQAALQAGIPAAASAMLVNQVCASGMMAVAVAAQMIQTGMARVAVAGGMESMSNAPHLLARLRSGIKLGDAELTDSLLHDGLMDAGEGWHMGEAAEAIARRFGVTRREQDEFAFRSHRRALAAQAEGAFREEIAPVTLQHGNETVAVADDEGPRPDTSLEALSRLRPAFDANGTVTAGNASQISDGAAALVLMGESAAHSAGLRVLARLDLATYVGIEPRRLFEAPVAAARKLLAGTGRQLRDLELIEINEAYAAQCLANGRELGWDWDRVNIHGGAIALGHPIGASGARILVTLLYAMEAGHAEQAGAFICHGGGGAAAMLLSRP